MSDNWEEKMTNPDDSNGFYFSVQETKTEDQLIKKVEEIIVKYKEHCDKFPLF